MSSQNLSKNQKRPEFFEFFALLQVRVPSTLGAHTSAFPTCESVRSSFVGGVARIVGKVGDPNAVPTLLPKSNTYD